MMICLIELRLKEAKLIQVQNFVSKTAKLVMVEKAGNDDDDEAFQKS